MNLSKNIKFIGKTTALISKQMSRTYKVHFVETVMTFLRNYLFCLMANKTSDMITTYIIVLTEYLYKRILLGGIYIHSMYITFKFLRIHKLWFIKISCLNWSI